MILLESTKNIESLQSLITSGIIDPSEGEHKLYMIKEKYVLKIHTRAINKRTDGRCITKVKKNGVLSQISAPNYQDLIIKLYDFYYGEQNSTLEILYPKWIEYRKSETATTQKTIKENSYLWDAHLKDESITKKPLKQLQPKDYIAFFRKLTKNRTITRKRFNDIKSVMNGIIYYAIEKEIISHNPLSDINYRQFSYKSEDNEIIPFTEQERLLLLEYIPENDIYDLAIKLAFHLTIRIGELKGLRFDDIQGNQLHVCRFINDKHEIIEDIKGHASSGKRWLPITNEAQRIINMIKKLNPDNNYLFMIDKEKKKFITTVTFNRRFKKYCNELNITYRSSHKIRFSTASILNAHGVTVPEIQRMLGHSTSTMTHHYLRNCNSKQETYEKVSLILT